MKFPKSVHAEGWLDHIEKTTPDHMPEALSGTAPKVTRKPLASMASAPLNTPRSEEIRRAPLNTTTTPVAAASGYTVPPSPTVVQPRSNGVAPWVLGAGAGAVLIAVAVMVSRNFAPSVDPVAPPPTVVGEAAKPSAEDAQLAAEPTAAGPVTEAPAAVAATTPAVTTPEPTPAPAVVAAAKPTPAPVEEKRVIAAAPTTPPAPRVQAPAPSPALQPLPSQVKTLPATPEPQVLAQATPPAAVPTPPIALTTPPVATAPTPEQATMPNAPTTVPPMAQAQPQADPQAPALAPEDAGITVKVRSALASDTQLSAVPIVVSTDHGVVKLEGQAPDPQARERATVVAAATQGVKGVDNRLTLPPVAQTQQLEPQQVARAQGN